MRIQERGCREGFALTRDVYERGYGNVLYFNLDSDCMSVYVCKILSRHACNSVHLLHNTVGYAIILKSKIFKKGYVLDQMDLPHTFHPHEMILPANRTA